MSHLLNNSSRTASGVQPHWGLLSLYREVFTMAGHAEQSEANAITQNSGDSGLSQSVSNAEMSNFSSVRDQMTTHSANLHNLEIEGLNNNSNGTTDDVTAPPSGAPELADNSGQNQMLTSETAADGPNGEANDPNHVNERADGATLMAEKPQDQPTNNPPRAGAEPAGPLSPEVQNDQAISGDDGRGPVNQNPRPEQTD
jgi:hypothetical protein